ncbi:MAG: hypothetical protein ACTSQE_07465 [Candidatus Heimdallarchaeaceae archaeon]
MKEQITRDMIHKIRLLIAKEEGKISGFQLIKPTNDREIMKAHIRIVAFFNAIEEIEGGY